MNYEIDPEFLKDIQKEEYEVARYNEYYALSENDGITPLSYTAWTQFDKKYQEHVRTAGSVLSPATFQRISTMTTNKPTVEQLQAKCQELHEENDRKLKRMSELLSEVDTCRNKLDVSERELSSLRHQYDKLLCETDKQEVPAPPEMNIQEMVKLFEVVSQVGLTPKELINHAQAIMLREQTPENYSMYPHYYREVPMHVRYVDIYWVLHVFGVKNPSAQHAIKKLMAAGARGSKDIVQDYEEARDSITRALELEETK